MSYNRYRKRHYNISDSKKREYANSMEELRTTFNYKYSDWDLSSMMDSCYKSFDNVIIRISNHSIDNRYHDIYNSNMLYVNIKASKLNFTNTIDNKVPIVLKFLKTIDLNKYRLITINDDRVNCFYKNFKTKKDTYTI